MQEFLFPAGGHQREGSPPPPPPPPPPPRGRSARSRCPALGWKWRGEAGRLLRQSGSSWKAVLLSSVLYGELAAN